MKSIINREKVAVILVLLLYIGLFIFGVLGNILLLVMLVRKKLYEDVIQSCVLNIVIASLLQVYL